MLPCRTLTAGATCCQGPAPPELGGEAQQHLLAVGRPDQLDGQSEPVGATPRGTEAAGLPATFQIAAYAIAGMDRSAERTGPRRRGPRRRVGGRWPG